MKCFNHAYNNTEKKKKNHQIQFYYLLSFQNEWNGTKNRKVLDFVSLFDFVTFYRSRMTPGDACVVSAFVKLCKPNNRRQMGGVK